MRQRGNAVQRAAEVEQDIGVGVIAAAGVCAAALAAVGVDINPALGVGLADSLLIVLAQRRNRLQHHLLCRLIAVGFFQIADKRCIDIVEVQCVHTQHLLAQADIAVHGRHVLAHRCDQIVVDLNRHIFPRHRHSTGGRIAAGCGLGCRRLDSAGVGRSKGVDVLAVALVIAVEGILAQGAVGAHLKRHKVGASDLHGLPLPILDRIEHHVGILEIVVDLRRRGHDLAEAGQQLFLGLGQGVRLAAQQVLEIEFVLCDCGVVDDGRQLVLGQAQDLGLGEGQRRDHLDIFAADAGIHALGGVIAGVLIVALRGIAIKALHLAAHLGGGVQIGPNRYGIAQLACKGRQALDVGIQTFQRSLPRSVAFIHRRQIPLELRVQLTALFQNFGHWYSPYCKIFCCAEDVGVCGGIHRVAGPSGTPALTRRGGFHIRPGTLRQANVPRASNARPYRL